MGPPDANFIRPYRIDTKMPSRFRRPEKMSSKSVLQKKSYFTGKEMVLLRQQNSGQQTFFLFLQPKILLQQPNVLLIEQNISLL